MANILYNLEPKIINTEPTCLIWLNEAIILQQFHYWIDKNKAVGVNFRDGRVWTFGTNQEYRDRNFPFWSFNTVKRTIVDLTDMGFMSKKYIQVATNETVYYEPQTKEEFDELMEIVKVGDMVYSKLVFNDLWYAVGLCDRSDPSSKCLFPNIIMDEHLAPLTRRDWHVTIS